MAQGNSNPHQSSNIMAQAGDGGGQVIIADSTNGGQIFVSAGDGAVNWSEISSLEEYDGTIWCFTNPCIGHIDIGGVCIGIKKKPSRLARFMLRILGWRWTEERSDNVKQMLKGRFDRANELS